jgi:hypothetical protein
MSALRDTALLALVMLACTTRGWPQRERFRDQLRCGQPPHEVEAIARQSGGTRWACAKPSESETVCNFTVKLTRVLLEFENGGLRRVEDGEQFGLTGVASWPRLDVCSGQLSRRFVITAPTTAWVDAVITVDGKEVARVRYRNDSVYLPVGRHTLRVEKAGGEAFVRDINVTEDLLREAPEISLP